MLSHVEVFGLKLPAHSLFQSIAALSLELAQQSSHYILYSDTREQFLGEGLSGFQFVGFGRKKEVVSIHDVVILANNMMSQMDL